MIVIGGIGYGTGRIAPSCIWKDASMTAQASRAEKNSADSSNNRRYDMLREITYANLVQRPAKYDPPTELYLQTQSPTNYKLTRLIVCGLRIFPQRQSTRKIMRIVIRRKRQPRHRKIPRRNVAHRPLPTGQSLPRHRRRICAERLDRQATSNFRRFALRRRLFLVLPEQVKFLRMSNETLPRQ